MLAGNHLVEQFLQMRSLGRALGPDGGRAPAQKTARRSHGLPVGRKESGGDSTRPGA